MFNSEMAEGEQAPPAQNLAAISTREQFGAELTRLRNAADLSIRQVARRAKVSPTTIGGWFAGKAVPAHDAMNDLHAVLRVCGADDQFESWRLAAGRIRATARAARPSGSPYRSLQPYRGEDAARFFGRDDLITALCDRVEAGLAGTGARVIGILGSSGSGKTSLLHAGLCPRLTVPVTVFSPGPDPHHRLDSTLSGLGTGPAVLVVDQAEELWTYRSASSTSEVASDANTAFSAAAEFIERLSTLTTTLPFVVVIALRADFFERATQHPILVPALTTDAVVVGPMTQPQLEQAIVLPAQQSEVVVEPALLTLLLQELAVVGRPQAHDPGALPLLSHALHETWTQRTTASARLTVEHYRSTGGIQGAIEQTAERVWHELDSESERSATQRIFTRGVFFGDTSLARRTVPATELEWSDIAGEATTTVIDRFVSARLLTTTTEGVQITHEALLHAWGRLSGWIEHDRSGLEMHSRLTAAARGWDRDDETTLLTKGRTEEYQQWIQGADRARTLTATEAEFVAASMCYHREVAAKERLRLRRLRILVGALFVVAVLSIAATAFAVIQRDGAEDARSAASTTRDLAISRQAALKANQLRDADPALAQQLAMAAYQVAPTAEAHAALLDSTTGVVPRRIPFTGRGNEVAGNASSALSGDEALLAVGHNGFAVQVIDRRVHDRISAPSPDGPIGGFDMTFRPGSSVLAAAGLDAIELWDFADLDHPRHIATTPASNHRLSLGVAWSPDGGELAATTDTGVLRWSVGPQLQMTQLPFLPSAVAGTRYDVAYSPDGKWLVCSGKGSRVQLWDRAAELQLHTVDVVGPVTPDEVSSGLFFDHNATTLAVTASGSDTATLVELGALTPAVRQTFSGIGQLLALSADGAFLVVGGSTGGVVVIDTSTGRRFTREVPSRVAYGYFSSTIDPALIVVSDDGFVREWPATDFTEPDSGSALTGLRVSDDRRIAVVPGGGPPRQTDLSALPRVSERGPRLPGPQPDPHSTPSVAGVPIAISNDGMTAAWSESDDIYTWDLRAAHDPRPLAAPIRLPAGGGVTAISLVSTSHGVGAFIAARDVVLIDPRRPSTNRPVLDLEDEEGEFVLSMVVSPDNRRLVIATNFRIALYELDTTGTELHPTPAFTQRGGMMEAAINHDSSLLAAARPGAGEIKLWDITAPTAVRQLESLTGPLQDIRALTFDTTGGHLAAAAENEVWLWQVANARQGSSPLLAVLNGPSKPTDLFYGPADTTLTAVGESPPARTWVTDPHVITAHLCAEPLGILTEQEWHQHVRDTEFRNPCSAR